jgi:hypothetical protein
MADIEVKDLEIIDNEERGVVNAANTVIVETRDDYETAGTFLKEIKAVMKKVEAVFEPIVKKAFEAHKQAKSSLNERLKPLEEAERIVKGKMSTFFAAEEEKRRAADRAKREEEARLAAEHEEKARELLDKGEFKKAESVLNAVEVLPEVQEKAKAEGVAMTKVWKFRIVNAALVPDVYRIIDERAIGATVRTLKERASIPGVETYFEFQARA